MSRLLQRGPDGYPEGADQVMREAYGPIPPSHLFQNDKYGYEEPVKVYGYQWSVTFGRWGAIVEFANGWKGLTWPKTWGEGSEGRDLHPPPRDF